MNTSDPNDLALIVEAILFSAGKPLTDAQILALFSDEERPTNKQLTAAIKELKEAYKGRAVELVKIASGYQFQSKVDYARWIGGLWEEKPARYSRALLETLAIVAYRQPVTRGEIEEIRGVAVSSSIFKTLHEERNWIRIVGHRDVPGRPGLYATTKQFLDYFGLATLDQLPSLPEIFAMSEEPEASSRPEDQQLEIQELSEEIESEAEATQELIEE